MTTEVQKKMLSLDLSGVSATVEPVNFQKLLNYRLDNPQRGDEIDNVYDCIFCENPYSPRSTVAVINKKYLTPREKDVEKKYVQYACGSCAERIKSAIKVPIDELEVAPASPSFTPRSKSERKADRYTEKWVNYSPRSSGEVLRAQSIPEETEAEIEADERDFSRSTSERLARSRARSGSLNQSSPSVLRRSSLSMTTAILPENESSSGEK